LKQANPLRHMK